MEQTLQAENPFAAPGRWYRGNLHTHTSFSDGLRSPADAVAWYQEHGYDLVAITDHDVRTEVEGLGSPGFLVLPGVEVHPSLNEVGEPYHVVGIGGSRGHGFACEHTVQEAIDQLRADGAVVWLAHPYWAGLTLPEMVAIHGTIGLEVYNATCARFGKGLSTVHWDDLLARGHLPWGLATDDTHWVAHDYGEAWVMVRAAELTPEAILQALASGGFYASQGPEIHDVQVSASEIYVRCSPVQTITCISLTGWGTQVVAPGPAQPLTEVSFPLRQQRVYIRLECADGQGRTAWSPPVRL